MKANELIAKAYYLSDIVSRELETVSGSQQADGLDLLNDLIAEKSAKTGRIPYYSRSSFNTVIGQESYFVSGLVDVSTVTYDLNEVRQEMRRLERKDYFGQSRANNIESIPSVYLFERELDGGRIYFYPLPSQVLNVDVTGKFSLPEVTGSDELSTYFDDFYVAYLKYALAERICNFYNIEFAPGKQKILQQKEREVLHVDLPDLKINKISSFSSNPGFNWAYANLGRGFLP